MSLYKKLSQTHTQFIYNVKKLVLVFATSTSVTGTSEEAWVYILCIYYLVWFRKDKDTIQALIDSDSKVNAMLPAYTKKLGLQIWETDVGTQKIDESTLSTFGIVITGFQV